MYCGSRRRRQLSSLSVYTLPWPGAVREPDDRHQELLVHMAEDLGVVEPLNNAFMCLIINYQRQGKGIGHVILVRFLLKMEEAVVVLRIGIQEYRAEPGVDLLAFQQFGEGCVRIHPQSSQIHKNRNRSMVR
ncbi:MAG: hypothetical protein WCF90_00015 [Methanomicrobiales archaeon]